MTLTRPQSVVVQKIASHFKLPSKKVREAVDEGSALEEGVLYLPGLDAYDINFHARFRCVDGKFNLNQTLNSVKFAKSVLYQAWLGTISSEDRWKQEILAYNLGGGNVLAVTGRSWQNTAASEGEGFITLAYDYLEQPIRIEPMQNFLSAAYPLPSEG